VRLSLPRRLLEEAGRRNEITTSSEAEDRLTRPFLKSVSTGAS
jgi:hypothetical protein